MQLLWKYVKKQRWLLVGTLALATINQGFSLLDPQIFRIIVDRYATQAASYTHSGFLRGVLLLLLASIGVALVSRIAKNFQDYYANVITQRVGTEMYSESVAHTFALPYAIFEDERSGEMLQKLQKARLDAQTLIMSAIGSIFIALVGIIFVIIYALNVHWSVGLVYILIIPVLGTVTFTISRKIKRAQKNIVIETANLAGSTTETIRNVEMVKSLGLEEQEITRLNIVNQKILTLELKKIKLIRTLSFIQGTCINALRSSLLLLMLWLIWNSAITVGEFFSLFIYSFFIFNPLGELANVFAQFQEASASLAAVAELLSRQVAPVPLSPVRLKSLESIEFKNVDFAYSGARSSAVSGINLKVHVGETVAFVGPSGSGKSTLVKLVLGLYQPEKGSLSFNTVNASKIDFEALRSRVGLVAQETQLFSGTIRDNLLFVKTDATDEECLLALSFAQATTILERSGQGLDTKIGEGGVKVSGGERQRLAIARALLRKPELIIFDEATSSLDSITEKEITDTIQSVEIAAKGVMQILVAHRLSTIAHAKRIYVLEKGKIIEEGTHESLLKKKGLYAALWREQSPTN
ncbi:MAG: ABC transporter ATP-binding protein [Candidatus Pacebacteria bacterium]|nr:ABC transporter ATP-binding protein [Candidatus Paceibacterota bacterium]MDD5357227.1 ABC transporter ATP-binding protein [Candidatus Paceibacterota bacterium]